VWNGAKTKNDGVWQIVTQWHFAYWIKKERGGLTAPLKIRLPEQRQKLLRCLVGDRQGLRTQLLLDLKGLKTRGCFFQISVDERADTGGEAVRQLGQEVALNLDPLLGRTKRSLDVDNVFDCLVHDVECASRIGNNIDAGNGTERAGASISGLTGNRDRDGWIVVRDVQRTSGREVIEVNIQIAGCDLRAEGLCDVGGYVTGLGDVGEAFAANFDFVGLTSGCWIGEDDVVVPTGCEREAEVRIRSTCRVYACRAACQRCLRSRQQPSF